MDLLAHIPELTGEKKLHLRMNILDIILKDKTGILYIEGNLIKSGSQCLKLLLGQQTDGLEHLDMSFRANDIKPCQLKIELAVISDCESLHLFGGGDTFIPKCCHTKIL